MLRDANYIGNYAKVASFLYIILYKKKKHNNEYVDGSEYTNQLIRKEKPVLYEKQVITQIFH